MARTVATSPGFRPAVPGEVGDLSHRVLALAAEGTPRVEFLERLLGLLRGSGRAARLELWIAEPGGWLRSRLGDDSRLVLDVLRREDGAATAAEVCTGAGLEPVGWEHGVLWARAGRPEAGTGARTVVPVFIGQDPGGWLVLAVDGPDYVVRRETAWFARAAGTIGTALGIHRVHAALRERVKELSALYGLAQLAARPGLTLEQLLSEVAELLPGAWQYPSIAVGRVELDLEVRRAGASGDPVVEQEAEVVVGGTRRGRVAVGYVESRPLVGEAPFLPEEEALLAAIASHLAVIVERRDAAVERDRLQAELLHADRLATLGMLAAGVGHELNEPLGSILGFAQLARKAGGVPAGVVADLERVEAAALHAREIVRKLVGFAHKGPALRRRMDLNQVVREGLELLAPRCRARAAEVVTDLAAEQPVVEGDPSQVQQVLVNLVVNALDAMPDGGRVTVATSVCGDTVRLAVADTGCGMSDEVRRRATMPFFTTRHDAGGTGLGLALVHDIVTGAGGTIRVDSEPDRGSEVTVELPAAPPAEEASG